MIVSFKDAGSEGIYSGSDSKAACKTCPSELWKVARRKLDYLDAAQSLTELASPPGNRLEKLGGNRSGQHSIRINDQYRICFVWTEQGPRDVEITDYH